MYGDEHERTLSHLDPKYRKTLEDNWRMMDETQDQEDRMVSDTMKEYSRRAPGRKKPARGTIKQKLIRMIDCMFGKSHG
jgi:hypothetical protein